MSKNGAQIVVDALIKEGVEVMFGYPGGSVLDIFDVLYESPIRFILTRHEQGAAHAADGYARATGKVGVCMATSGPGAMNLVTGLATAHMDSIPIVAMTGQVPTQLIGNDAFQEADVVGVTRPVTKHNYLVKSIEELPIVMKNAFHVARTGRPGPVLVDIPKDIQKMLLPKYAYPKSPDVPGYKPTVQGHPRQIKLVAEAIKDSNRPLLYVGGGAIASDAAKEVFELATKCEIPVTTTLMGLGAFPETHDLSLKMLGMHGTTYANYAVQNSDLIIAVGARFDDRITGRIDDFAPYAKVVHIDIDPSAISKNIRVHIPVVGDCKNVLKELNKLVSSCKHKEWLQLIAKWKKESPLGYKKDDKLRPQYVIEQIWDLTKGNAIITSEVGQNQMWSAQFYKFTKPRTWLSSGGLGTMGYGFPAAIGAQMGNPDKLVIDIAGDGSIQMNIQELATAVINNIPVKIVILNNGCLGMVRQWQELFYKSRYAHTILGPDPMTLTRDGVGYIPDFVKLAEAYGAVGMRVTEKKDVKKALKKAFETPKTVVMEFIVNEEENVYPMVPAGASLNQMIGGMA